jgi:hypothetical protein
MSQTIEEKNKALVLKHSTHCSTSVTRQHTEIGSREQETLGGRMEDRARDRRL